MNKEQHLKWIYDSIIALTKEYNKVAIEWWFVTMTYNSIYWASENHLIKE